MVVSALLFSLGHSIPDWGGIGEKESVREGRTCSESRARDGNILLFLRVTIIVTRSDNYCRILFFISPPFDFK